MQMRLKIELMPGFMQIRVDEIAIIPQRSSNFQSEYANMQIRNNGILRNFKDST